MKNEKANTSAPDKQGTEIRPGLMPRPRVSLETGTVNPAELNAWTADRAFRRIEHFAEIIALAILRNPKVDQLLGRNPLDPGRAGDHANAGAALAHASLRLADDYVQALDVLLRTRAQALPAPVERDEHAEPGQSI